MVHGRPDRCLGATECPTLTWLQSTDLGNVVLVVLMLVFALLGIMTLRAFAPR